MVKERYYEFKSINGDKIENGRRFYLISWADKANSQSWQPLENLQKSL
jgi:hypothetical protein